MKNLDIHNTIIAMLKAEVELDKFVGAIERSEVLEVSYPDLGLLSVVYGIMGFPENQPEDDGFSRDWLGSYWFDMPCNDSKALEYLAWLKQEIEIARVKFPKLFSNTPYLTLV